MKHLIPIFILLLFTVSCNKAKKDRGIIEQELNEVSCFPLIDQDLGFVISSQAEYDTFYANNNCDLAQQTAIDFSRHTLLGKRATGKCKVKYYRQVKSDEASQSYIYTIWVKDRGLCKKRSTSMNWVLVPKLPTNWSVSFLIK